nr:unnamed protein product [Callosobruchus analis]
MAQAYITSYVTTIADTSGQGAPYLSLTMRGLIVMRTRILDVHKVHGAEDEADLIKGKALLHRMRMGRMLFPANRMNNNRQHMLNYVKVLDFSHDVSITLRGTEQVVREQRRPEESIECEIQKSSRHLCSIVRKQEQQKRQHFPLVRCQNNIMNNIFSTSAASGEAVARQRTAKGRRIRVAGATEMARRTERDRERCPFISRIYGSAVPDAPLIPVEGDETKEDGGSDDDNERVTSANGTIMPPPADIVPCLEEKPQMSTESLRSVNQDLDLGESVKTLYGFLEFIWTIP